VAVDEDELRAKVLGELGHVRVYGYWGLNSSGKAKEPNPYLEESAKEVPGYGPRLTRSAAIELLLRSQVPLVPRPYADWLMVLFGLNEERWSTDTGELRKQAAELAGEKYSEVFRRTKEKQALSALADQIVTACLMNTTAADKDQPQEPMTAEEGAHIPTSMIALSESLIRRPGLVNKLRWAAEESRLVCVTGEAGVGKTTLVMHYISSITADSILVLRGHDEDSLTLDIAIALDVREDSLATNAVKLRLQRWLTNEANSSSVLVIDDLREWRLMEQILPQKVLPTVIITARREFMRPNVKHVEVGELEVDEIIQMARSIVPNISNDVLRAIVALGGRALVVEQVSALIRDQSDQERLAFLAELNQDLSSGLDMMAGEHETTSLVTVYQDIVESMAGHREMRHALKVLKHIAFAGNGHFWRIVARCVGQTVDVVDTTSFASACHILHRLRLIYAFDRAVGMRDITRTILRKIFSSELSEISASLIAAIELELTVPPEEGYGPYLVKSLFSWCDSVEIVGYGRERHQIERLGWEVADYAYRQTGNARFRDAREQFGSPHSKADPWKRLQDFRWNRLVKSGYVIPRHPDSAYRIGRGQIGTPPPTDQ
jgi:hypothetical protein